MRKLALIALLFALPSFGWAQRMGAAHFSGRPGPFFSHANRSGLYPGFSDLYSDYFSGYPGSSQPTYLVLQSPPVSVPTPAPSDALMIELQGNRYVQISPAQASQAQADHAELIDANPAPSAPSYPTPRSSPPPQPTTVLIFRDGHRQEISGYTITNGTLYASSDFYRSGSWNQKIELSALNLSDTADTNQSRGVPFRIPSASNEVIVGP